MKRVFLAVGAVFTLVGFGVPTITGSAAAQSTPKTYKPYFDYLRVGCGRENVLTMLDLEVKRDGDVKSADADATAKDARAVIQLANTCLHELKQKDCASDAPGMEMPPKTLRAAACNDAAIFLQTEILFAQGDLGPTLANKAASMALLGEELYGALELCRYDAISQAGDPYDRARVIVSGDLTIAARFHRGMSDSPVEEYLTDLRACAQRIGANVAL